MKKVLVVIDMQTDFVDGTLGTPEAAAIVDNVVKEIENWDGPVICTRDTHEEDYLETQEGHNLPVTHCVRGSAGWQLTPRVQSIADEVGAVMLDKPSFGSLDLSACINSVVDDDELECIELIGLCTDICVISNALILKAAFPEVPVAVKADCCAGVTPEQHRNALEAMKPCQVMVI